MCLTVLSVDGSFPSVSLGAFLWGGDASYVRKQLSALKEQGGASAPASAWGLFFLSPTFLEQINFWVDPTGQLAGTPGKAAMGVWWRPVLPASPSAGIRHPSALPTPCDA